MTLQSPTATLIPLFSWVRISWSVGSEKLFGHVQKSQSSALKGMHTITGCAESNGETLRSQQNTSLIIYDQDLSVAISVSLGEVTTTLAKYWELGVPHRTKKRVRHNYSYICCGQTWDNGKSWNFGLSQD